MQEGITLKGLLLSRPLRRLTIGSDHLDLGSLRGALYAKAEVIALRAVGECLWIVDPSRLSIADDKGSLGEGFLHILVGCRESEACDLAIVELEVL